MHPTYERILGRYQLAHSKGWQAVFKCFLLKLCPPNELSEDWILRFLSSHKNPNTKGFYFKCLKIVLKSLGKLDLIKDLKLTAIPIARP